MFLKIGNWLCNKTTFRRFCSSPGESPQSHWEQKLLHPHPSKLQACVVLKSLKLLRLALKLEFFTKPSPPSLSHSPEVFKATHCASMYSGGIRLTNCTRISLKIAHHSQEHCETVQPTFFTSYILSAYCKQSYKKVDTCFVKIISYVYI